MLSLIKETSYNKGVNFSKKYRRFCTANMPEWLKSCSRAREIFEKTNLFHGSRHFVKNGLFLLEKVNTGEGAQVYGWGLYFAENKETAEWYRLAGIRGSRDPKTALQIRFQDGTKFIWNTPKNRFEDDKGRTLEDYLKSRGFDFGVFEQVILNSKEFQKGIWVNSSDYYASHLMLKCIGEYEVDVDTKTAKLKREIEKLQAALDAEDPSAIRSVRAKTNAIAQRQTKVDEIEKYIKDPLIKELRSTTFELVTRPSWVKVQKGNLYFIEGPDKDDFLYWDGKVSKQPHIMSFMDEVRAMATSAPDKTKLGKILASIKALAGQQGVDIMRPLLDRTRQNKWLGKTQFLTEPEAKKFVEISNDPEKAQKMLGKYWWNIRFGGDPSGINLPADPTGRELYRFLEIYLGSAKNASMWLKDHGVPALYYLDAGSRGVNGDVTYNWVVWTEGLVKTLRVEGDVNMSF